MKNKKSKIRQSARGKECQVRMPGVCSFDETTTVFAHLNVGGTGGKASDLHGAYACYKCHDAIDGRGEKIKGFSADDILIMFYEAVFRTQAILLSDNLISIGRNNNISKNFK